MSGSGRSTALKMMEDAGFFCIDNLPVPLVQKFAELAESTAQEYSKVVLGLDARSMREPKAVEHLLKTLEECGQAYEILFLDAADATLLRRYKETRRSHPMTKEGSVQEGIGLERKLLEDLKRKADYIIDTSQLLTRELKQELDKIFVQNQEFKNLYITVQSFGFKYGLPADADLVFDVRFLPNPYYVEELRLKTGNDKEIQDFVLNCDAAEEFISRLTGMLDFLIPNYVREGKNQLVIAVGCTGGKHRSVTLANRIYEYLSIKQEYGLKIYHKDIDR